MFVEYCLMLDNGNLKIESKKRVSKQRFQRKKMAFRDFLYQYSSPFRKNISCELNNCACRINSFIWISHKYKAIWFENPKAASRSILSTLCGKEPSIYELLYLMYRDIEYRSKPILINKKNEIQFLEKILPNFNKLIKKKKNAKKDRDRIL